MLSNAVSTSPRNPGDRHQVRLSAVVMTHPRRQAQAARLAARLAVPSVVLDPQPESSPSPLRTAVEAWRRMDADSTHHLVLQDDIDADASLLTMVAVGAARHPRAAVAYYANWDSRNGAAVHLAALAGASWVRAHPEDYTPSLALCLPADVGLGFATYARDITIKNDDETMSAYLRDAGCATYLAVPTPVEHLGDVSISDMDFQGIRRSACHLADPEVVGLLATGDTVETIDHLPVLRVGGRSEVILNTVAGSPGVPWQDALAHMSLTSDDVVGEWTTPQEGRRLAGWRTIADELGVGFAFNLWVHCYLVGWQAHRIAGGLLPRPNDEHAAIRRRVRRAAVGTIGVGSIEPGQRRGVSPTLRKTLRRCAEDRIRQGAQANIGMSASGHVG